MGSDSDSSTDAAQTKGATMKFKKGMMKRRISEGVKLFKKHQGITGEEVSRTLRKRFGFGMSSTTLKECRLVAQRALTAKAVQKEKQRKEREELKRKKLDVTTSSYPSPDERAKELERASSSKWKAAPQKPSHIPMTVEMRWTTPSPSINHSAKNDGLPKEFSEGLRTVRSALAAAKQSGTITLINYDERMEVKYDLEIKTEKVGAFDVK